MSRISNPRLLGICGLTFCIAVLVLCGISHCCGWKMKGMGVMIYDSGATNSAEIISMVQVLANPEKYDGKRIRFVGYLVSEFECHAVFLDEESYKHYILSNSIFLQHDFGKRTGKVHRKYCLVEGTYKAIPEGYMAANNGALEEVSRISMWWN